MTAQRGKFYRPSEATLAHIGEAVEGAVLSEMSWPEIGQVAVDALAAAAREGRDAKRARGDSPAERPARATPKG